MAEKDGLLLEHSTVQNTAAVDNASFVIDEEAGGSAQPDASNAQAALDDFFYKDNSADLPIRNTTTTTIPEFDGVDGGPRESYGSWYQTSYYISFFDVNADDIKHRLIKVFAPTSALLDPVDDAAHTGPDLYGPMWIVTTLILLMPMVVSLREWISTNVLGVVHDTSLYSTGQTFHRFSVAASLLYGYSAALAVGVWVTRKYCGLPIELFCSICLHGYSFAPFVPAAILSIIPHSLVTSLLFVAAFISSSLFQWVNIWRADREDTADQEAGDPAAYGATQQTGKGLTLAFSSLVVHALFVVFLRVYFFR